MLTRTTNSDVLSRIHCGYEQLKTFNSTKPDGELKPERRVRFPDDEVISDYLEPFRPVPDNCTSEELITAYIDSCFHYKVQPVEFLLEQLKGIDLSICNERYSRLSLKGVRLSRLQVETLEEIFRRVHFRELDFENICLDDQSAVALFDMLLHYETCNKLNITLNLNRFHQSQAWARCVMFLRRSSELRSFTLSNTALTIDNFLGMSFFGLSLNSLSLRNCCLSGQALYGLVRWLRLLLSSASLDPPNREKVCDYERGGKRSGYVNSRNARRSRLVNTAEKSATGVMHPSIWNLKLDVSCNKLNVSDAETMLTLIRHQLLVPDLHSRGLEKVDGKEYLPVGGIGFLEHLDVSNNQIGDDGLRVISTGLLQSYRARLRLLHSFPGEEVDDDTSVSCSTGYIRQTPPFGNSADKIMFRVRGLEHLSLANNGLTASGMQSITLVLMQTPSTLVPMVGGLVSLDLSHNPNIRDTGVEILCDGLMRNHSLKMLYLKAINMSFSGIFALSGFLSESKCLNYLDIRMNQLSLASLMALSKTLLINYSLTSLLSDARNLASSTDPLVASDAELTLVLLDEIDSCLRRNRILTETSQHLPLTTITLQEDAHNVSPVSSPRRYEVLSASTISSEDKEVNEHLGSIYCTEDITTFPPYHLVDGGCDTAVRPVTAEEYTVSHPSVHSVSRTINSPHELVNEVVRTGHSAILQIPCSVIGTPNKNHLSLLADQSSDLLSEVSSTEVTPRFTVNPSDASQSPVTDSSTYCHSAAVEADSAETLRSQPRTTNSEFPLKSCSSLSGVLMSPCVEGIKMNKPRRSRQTRNHSSDVKDDNSSNTNQFVS